jgi:hypothetical protein
LLIFFRGILTTLYQFLERIFLYKLICISYSWKFAIKSSVINTAKKIFIHFWRSGEKIIDCGMKYDIEHGTRGFSIRITRFWDSLGSIWKEKTFKLCILYRFIRVLYKNIDKCWIFKRHEMLKLMIFLTEKGVSVAARNICQKIWLILKSFRSVLPIRKNGNFLKNHFSWLISKRIRAIFTRPPQPYALFHALQSDMHLVNRKTLKAKLFYKQ